MEQEIEEIEAEEFPVERDNALEEQFILSHLDADPNDVRWMISAFRIPRDGGKDVGIFRLNNPRELANIMDRLQKYGSGDYRVIVYRNGRIFKKLIYPVEVLPVATVEPNANRSDMSIVLAAIEKQNQTMMTFMERMMERPREETRSGFDPMAMVEKTIGMAASLAGLRNDQPSAGLSVESMMTLITKGMEIGQQSAANGGGDSGGKGILDVIDSALRSPLVSDILSRQLAAPQMNVAPEQRPMPQTSMPIHPVGQPPQQAAIPPTAVFFAQIVSQLGEQAKSRVEVTQAAPWVEAHVPATMVGDILNDPRALDRLSDGFPIVREHRGWFAALLQELHRRDTEDFGDSGTDSADGDTGGNSRYSGNAESHAPDNSDGHS